MIDFNDTCEVWDYLESNGLFNTNELDLVTNINGYSVETLNDMIYARYGYRDLEQLIDEE